jgi:hypothetical protein
MLVLRSPDDAVRVADPRVRALVELRFSQLSAGEPFDSEVHGCFVGAEPGDSAEALEDAIGFPVVHDAFGESRFGDSNFVPAAEIIEDRECCFELAFVLNGDGFAVALFVPKVDGVDPELLVMCEAHAIPSEVISGR